MSTSHFVLVPFMAQGHLIPMLDLAQLIAARSSTLVSFVTTPVNTARIQSAVDRIKSGGLPINFVDLTFPCTEAGLPEGCENVDLLPSFDLIKQFFDAIPFLRQPLEAYLRSIDPVPSCMIVDYCNWFASEVASELAIPRVIFHGPPCLYILSYHRILEHKIHDVENADPYEPFVVPGLPKRVEISRAQAPGWFYGAVWKPVLEKATEAERSADGIIINTFYELEPDFVDCYKMAIKKPVWTVGPFSLYNKDVPSQATRGRKPAVDEHRLLSWLDAQALKSVLYVSFGSIVRSKVSQVIEIARGLEASNRPFIWTVKESEKWPELEEFEERTTERGLVIKGWAPQVVILSHPSVGGFMTHCGWNSTLEAICAAVPMIAWPHFADQFINEKLVVEVLEIGVSVGVKVPFHLVKEEEVQVKGEDVEKAISRLMDGGEEGERRRARAAVLAGNGQKAMEEGGSSYHNLTLFLQHFLKSEQV